MKKRKTMLIFGMSLMLLVSGCTENKTDTSSQDTNSQDTNSQDKESRSRMDNGIFGQVTEVGEDYIIIEENGQLENNGRRRQMGGIRTGKRMKRLR